MELSLDVPIQARLVLTEWPRQDHRYFKLFWSLLYLREVISLEKQTLKRMLLVAVKIIYLLPVLSLMGAQAYSWFLSIFSSSILNPLYQRVGITIDSIVCISGLLALFAFDLMVENKGSIGRGCLLYSFYVVIPIVWLAVFGILAISNGSLGFYG